MLLLVCCMYVHVTDDKLHQQHSGQRRYTVPFNSTTGLDRHKHCIAAPVFALTPKARVATPFIATVHHCPLHPCHHVGRRQLHQRTKYSGQSGGGHHTR